MSGMTFAIVGTGIELAYGSRMALATSDFHCPTGGITAVIGPNGSGKSTLLHACAGILKPRRGELRVNVSGPRHRSLAYVFQSTKVNETMPVTVREVVGMGRYSRLGPFRPFGAADRAACRTAMERLDVADLAGSHLDELSGGQRQRVFVAQGLAQEADILLLDEPITGLDLVSKERIIEVVKDERTAGRTVIGTTHDLSEAAIADHVLLLAGRVVAEGPPDEVLTTERLSEAYGMQVVRLEEGTLVLDDHHHHPEGGRHVHFDRTGRADHGTEAT
jgi:manganese transport system ATP-binding protein